MLGPHHGLLKFYTLLMFAFFHLRVRRAELRGLPLVFTHAVSSDVSVFEARLHDDLQILRLQMMLEIDPKPSCS